MFAPPPPLPRAWGGLSASDSGVRAGTLPVGGMWHERVACRLLCSVARSEAAHCRPRRHDRAPAAGCGMALWVVGGLQWVVVVGFSARAVWRKVVCVCTSGARLIIRLGE